MLTMDASDVQQKIEAHLRARGLSYRRVDHPAVRTSEEAARVRGTDLQIGGKSLVMKIGDSDRFGVFALRADQRSHGRSIRKALGVSRLRFATAAELLRLTGLTPGCVPPFGRPIFDLELYVDEALARQQEIAFTAGSHTCSLVMGTASWLDAAAPTDVLGFARSAIV